MRHVLPYVALRKSGKVLCKRLITVCSTVKPLHQHTWYTTWEILNQASVVHQEDSPGALLNNQVSIVSRSWWFVFQVRNHPLYHLIKARVQKKMGHPEESVNTMRAAMNLSGVKKAGNTPYIMYLTDYHNIFQHWNLRKWKKLFKREKDKCYFEVKPRVSHNMTILLASFSL